MVMTPLCKVNIEDFLSLAFGHDGLLDTQDFNNQVVQQLVGSRKSRILTST
jgi:hypothetical protein